MRKHEPSPERIAEREILDAIARSNERLREIDRLFEATLERTGNWREELAVAGSDR